MGLELGLLAVGEGAGAMLICAGQEVPAPMTPQQRVAAPWPHGGGEDVWGKGCWELFPVWPLGEGI